MSGSFSRGDVLRMCTAFGALTLATPLPIDVALDLMHAAEDRSFSPTPTTVISPTPTTVMGPFFKKSAPRTTVLRTTSDPGLPLSVKGRVTNVRGDNLNGAVIEVWQLPFQTRLVLCIGGIVLGPSGAASEGGGMTNDCLHPE